MTDISPFDLDLVPVAATDFNGTGKFFDRRLFDKVIALRDKTYLKDAEREPVEVILKRIDGEGEKTPDHTYRQPEDIKDPVNLEIFALRDRAGEVKAFSIIETYLDKKGKPISGCMTYANADQAFARQPGALKELKRLHDATIAGKNYPIIVEVNPGDRKVYKDGNIGDIYKDHPFDMKSNGNPLVVEMAIKLGVDPAKIPKSLIDTLIQQANPELSKGQKRTSKTEIRQIIESGANILRDDDGKAVSAIVPATYNTLNLQPNEKLGKVGQAIDLTQGGPKNLHLALINISDDGKSTAYKDASKAYKDLSRSIAIGNTGLSPRIAELAVSANLALQRTHHEIGEVEEHAVRTKMGVKSAPSRAL